MNRFGRSQPANYMGSTLVSLGDNLCRLLFQSCVGFRRGYQVFQQCFNERSTVCTEWLTRCEKREGHHFVESLCNKKWLRVGTKKYLSASSFRFNQARRDEFPSTAMESCAICPGCLLLQSEFAEALGVERVRGILPSKNLKARND